MSDDIDEFILPPPDPYYDEIQAVIDRLHESLKEMADTSWLAEYLVSPEYLNLLELAPPLAPELLEMIAGPAQ